MKLTMVIADDELLSLQNLKQFICREFSSIEIVGLASNGIELKNMLEAYEPDMAIVDIRMPGLTGLEVIQLCRHKGLKTHFLLHTAYSEFEYVKTALDLQTDGYLLKPGKREERRETIARMCDRVEKEKRAAERELQVESAIEVVNPALGSEILLSFISGIGEIDAFRGYCSINHLVFYKAFMATYLLDQKLPGSTQKEIYQRIGGSLAGTCAFMMTVSEQEAAVLIFLPEELEMIHEKTWCQEAAQLIADELQQYTGRGCLYGMGTVISDISMIRCSYQESRKALSAQMETDGDTVAQIPEKAEVYVTAALDYIRAHFREDISLEDCAAEVGISPYYLSHLIREKTGETFIAGLSLIRINEAKRLCRDPSVPIKDIVVRCGYSNITYFYRVFKKATGMSAGEYRKLCLEQGGK